LKIFLPFKKDLNPYLDEIQRYSKHNFIYGNYKNYSPSYNIVNIHWPEAIFDWHEPTEEQLHDLEKAIEKWKKNSFVVYTKHDVGRHKGMTPNFTRLFKLIENNTDVFIHLGKNSQKFYSDVYPKAKHEMLFHPIYENTFDILSKEEARGKLEIAKDAVVIIAPGNIRSFAERRMVLKAFKKLKIKNKVLIAPTMRSEIKYDFRGRVKLKKLFNVRDYVVNRFKRKHQPPEYLFSYQRINDNDLSIRMSAADIVLIPRIEILNSGTFFLGLTFNKVVVGPETGNLQEQLKQFKMPSFNPASISSVTRALEKGIALSNSKHSMPDEDLKEFRPKSVAREMDAIFKRL